MHVFPGPLGALADRIGHLSRLADAYADAALAVSDDDAEDLIGRVELTEMLVQHTGDAESRLTVWGTLDEPWTNGSLGDWNFGCSDGTGDKGVWNVTQTAGDCVLAILQACTDDDTIKSALARGEFPCIGATTTQEYHRHIERDPALDKNW